MVSIRGKIWFSIINRIIKKLDTLFDIDKLDNQKLGSSFPRWKKAPFVDISEFKIDELEVLKIKNRLIINCTVLKATGVGLNDLEPPRHKIIVFSKS